MNALEHLAIIMDGNGRWAKNQNKPRSKGHEEGAKTVRKITKYVAKTDIKFLTLYAFSTENWSRPKAEVMALMKLLEKYLTKERKTFAENDIRFNYIGDVSLFSDSLRRALDDTCEITKHGTSLTQTLALNYGSQDEIVRAVNKLIKEDVKIDKESLESALDTGNMPLIDLLVRTGGEKRLSNFLLWQSAYAELHFSDTLWPDFEESELEEIVGAYKNINRRFGGL